VDKSIYVHAAKTILRDCLQIPPSASFLIFSDETTIETTRILLEAAAELSLCPISLYYETAQQAQLIDLLLPVFDEMFFGESPAVLNCISFAPESFHFRDQIRTTAWNAGCRVAHMPGIAPDTLLLAGVDQQVMSADCEMLALTLLKGSRIAIETQDRAGNVHRLEAGIHASPTISDGVIDRKSWGNVPSGETFITPDFGSAEGSIVIDGSLPGLVISLTEPLILQFSQGRLVDILPQASAAAQHLRSTQIEQAMRKQDKNWSLLCEIGIGANPMVTQLTGNPLLDEKKRGTLHIAIGDNIDMGGAIESAIHCDMVTHSPVVLVDNHVIVANGELVIDRNVWQDDHRTLITPPEWHLDSEIVRTGSTAYVDGNRRLRRSWYTDSGKLCSVQVGRDQTAWRLGNVYEALQRSGHPTTCRKLSETLICSAEEILQLTYLMTRYQLTELCRTDRLI
jgi:hypothetical protein